jgi:hypothetical protein
MYCIELLYEPTIEDVLVEPRRVAYDVAQKIDDSILDRILLPARRAADVDAA